MNALTPALMGAPVQTATSVQALSFRFNLRPLTVIVRDGAPWFVAKEACAALDIANHRDAILKLDADEKGVALTDTPGGPQEVSIISESGLYTLILRCRGATTPGTVPHRFRRFVTSEVLPQVRHHGSYGAPDLDDNQTLRRLLLGKLEEVDNLRAIAAAERQARIEAEDVASLSDQEMLDMGRALTVVTHRAEASAARVEVLQPKAVAYERIAGARGSKTVTDFARDTRLKPKRVFELLDRRGWICRRNSRELGRKGPWMATVWGQERGFVEHAMGAVDVAGSVVETRQLVITPAGQRVLEDELAQGRLDLRRPKKG